MISNSPEVSNFNWLFLKLNMFSPIIGPEYLLILPAKQAYTLRFLMRRRLSPVPSWVTPVTPPRARQKPVLWQVDLGAKL